MGKDTSVHRTLKALGFFPYGTGHSGGDTYRHSKLPGMRVRSESTDVIIERKVSDYLGKRWVTVERGKYHDAYIFKKIKGMK
jgi:hypothetical protein